MESHHQAVFRNTALAAPGWTQTCPSERRGSAQCVVGGWQAHVPTDTSGPRSLRYAAALHPTPVNHTMQTSLATKLMQLPTRLK